jgi:endoglucanase
MRRIIFAAEDSMRRREFLKMATVCGGAAALPIGFGFADRWAWAADDAVEAGPIVFNQLGYLQDARKIVTVRSSLLSSLPSSSSSSSASSSIPSSSSSSSLATFTVRALRDGAVVLKDKLGAVREDAASGDRVQVCDISSVRAAGTYFIEIDGGAGARKSAPFEIGSDVYRRALWLTMRSYYGQRCGCSVDLGDGYAHPPCHLDAAFHASSGKSGPFKNHGGWHDAGDYGRYVVNSGISTGTLLWAWEILNGAVRKLDLKIPESGGKMPDFLLEIKWNLDWMLSLQDADGGVWHKQTSENFCAFIMPQDDHMTSYVIGTGAAPYKSTGATADLAAVAAIAARCYGPYDDAYAKKCTDAAKQSYAWASKNPNVRFENPAGVRTGGYGDDDCRDELLWAAAELWRTTGDDEYRKAFEAGIGYLRAEGGLKITTPGWGDLSAMALWTYAMAERKGASSELVAQIHEASAHAAEGLVRNSRENGYGNTMALADYVWGSNGVAGNQSLQLIVADRLQKNPEFRVAAMENLHYLLGRNCWDLSWVTGLGRNACMHPHHRPSGADGISAPWPGLLSGGPNGHPADPAAKGMTLGPPMKMYRDVQAAYSMNEIAINWNAPLVFLLAGVNEGG